MGGRDEQSAQQHDNKNNSYKRQLRGPRNRGGRSIMRATNKNRDRLKKGRWHEDNGLKGSYHEPRTF